jgi:hypothetical protein
MHLHSGRTAAKNIGEAENGIPLKSLYDRNDRSLPATAVDPKPDFEASAPGGNDPEPVSRRRIT